jgi:hypothetical protein
MESTKPKPKLRSVPKATRVILRQKGEKCSQVAILDGIFSRYDLADNEDRRKHVRKLLNRALERGTNDTQDIKKHKNSFSLIVKQSARKSGKPAKGTKSRSKKADPTPQTPTPPRGSSTLPTETNTTESSTHKWQYFDNGWFDYHPDASKAVEEAYQDYVSNPGMWDVRAVKSGRWHYQVDFPNMKQTNIEHDDHTQRDIRRIAL